MSEEFKCRALTSEDWKDIEDKDLTAEGGLRLKKDKRDGCYISKSLDSGKEGCRWHRIVLDVDVPENSTITVSFYSSDKEEKEEAGKSWYGTLVFKKANDDFKKPKDALVQALPGRYITLKIEFHSEGEKSPVLKQVWIYYPRLSYLRHLPAVYQEESASKEFLERFLSIFESALHDSEETISRIPVYFDPLAAPKDFYIWLASWLSLDLYELLGDRNREFILRAVEFYKQKGTVSGIASIVSFLTGKKCCVKEYMNNVFRSYGMEHEEDEIVDIRECRRNIKRTAEYIKCTKFYRETSKTVDTEDSDLLANIGKDKYCDGVHYVIDTSKDGRYSPHVIGLFIFLDAGEKLGWEKEEIRKIIKSFLPVFVRAEIITVEGPFEEEYVISRIVDEYEDSIHSFLAEEFKDVGGVYKDSVSWEWLYTHKGAWYLFNWDKVPGNDSERLLRYFMTAHDIGWAENAEIRKSDDGKTIHISKDENSAEIVIDEDKEKATLKIRDGRIYDLKVKKENGKLNLYDAYKERTNNLYYRTPHSKIGVWITL